MNADEIVKALRHCYQEDIHGCAGCPLNDIDLCYGANLELSAADLIESLQKQLNDMTDAARQNYCKFVRTREERDELQKQLAERTVYGYDIEDLILVAELLRKNEITEKGLRGIKFNFVRAYEVLRKEMEQATKNAISEAFNVVLK